ncbi:MAG: bifunctional UDP-sugar hydrolase/5'-nucleotidase [Clostridia bacterium]
MNKKLGSLLLALVLVLGLCAPAMAAEAAEPAKLIILHTNDVHGRAVTDLSEGSFGYAAVAKVKKDLLATGASVLLLDAGDASQGMPLVNLNYGESAMAFMNAVGYDAMAPGNHEFDWGLDVFLQTKEVAEFPILAANIVDKISGEPLFTPNKVFDMPNGMKVGVFGLDTPEVMTKSNPDKVTGMRIFMEDELYACAQAQVDELKAAGCDLVVCLGHLGVSDESKPNRSTDVLDKVTGIDLFIDGHSHTEMDGGEKIGDTLLVSTGSYLNNIGMVTYDGKELEAKLISAKVDEDALDAGLIVPVVDEEVNLTINALNDKVQAELNVPFATTEIDLNGERAPGVRTEETNLGDFCCDAILWAAQKAVSVPVVAAINNGGGIRASIEAGEITMNDMKTVFPYGNQVTVLTVTGAELLEALEAATCTTPDPIGAFPQVSGMVITIDTTVPYENGEMYPDSTYYAPAKPGARVTIDSIGGEPFDPAKNYNIATNDFSAAGGDTYYVFRYANETSGYVTGVALEDALIDYVTTELGGVVKADAYGQTQGRITVKQ